MQFVAKISTPGYTLLHFHNYSLSINTYTSNLPTSIISFQKNTSTISLIIFCTSTLILLSCFMYQLNECMCTDFKEIKTKKQRKNLLKMLSTSRTKIASCTLAISVQFARTQVIVLIASPLKLLVLILQISN